MASGGKGWWEGSVPTHAFLTQGAWVLRGCGCSHSDHRRFAPVLLVQVLSNEEVYVYWGRGPFSGLS